MHVLLVSSHIYWSRPGFKTYMLTSCNELPISERGFSFNVMVKIDKIYEQSSHLLWDCHKDQIQGTWELGSQ